MSTHTVTINGIELVYDKEGSGPAVVFLHGGNASSVCWEAVVPHFMGEYTCYVLDQRGHGRSGRSSEKRYSLDDFAADCGVFLEKVTRPAILVGHSMGGMVALASAAQCPELVRAVYSEDAVLHLNTPFGQGETVAVVALFGALQSLAVDRERERWSPVKFAHEMGKLTVFGPPLASLWPPQTLAFFARVSQGCDPVAYSANEPDWTDAQADAACADHSVPGAYRGGQPRKGRNGD